MAERKTVDDRIPWRTICCTLTHTLLQSPRKILAAFALAAVLVHPVCAQVNITTWQGDNLHTGSNTNETILTPGTVSAAGNFGLQEFGTIDGQSYGQPLLLGGVTLSDSSVHNMVYVGTEHASIFGFDANVTNQSSATAPLQSFSMVPAGTAPTKQGSGAGEVPSGDILVEYGMTTTPVIDPTSNTIYAVSKVTRTSDSTIHQYLYAIDLTTFQPKFNSPVEITPTFAGNSTDGDASEPDSVNGVITFDALRQHLRSSMVLYNGVVYLAWASHSDVTPYHGLIVGYDARTLAIRNSFNSTPTGNNPMGGFWGAGAGPAIDANGFLYIAVANGSWNQTTMSTYGCDWGESMLKMDTSKPFTVDFTNTNNWFTPNIWNTLNDGDLDVGSGGLLLLPPLTGPEPNTPVNIMVGGGKGAVLYVVSRDSLSGLNTPDAVIQEITEPTHLLNGTPTSSGIFTTPSYFNNSIYYAAAGLPLEQRRVGYNSTTGGYISDPPILAPGNGYNNRGAFISANGTNNGIAWVLNGNGVDAFDASNISLPKLVTVNTTIPPSTGCQNTKFSLPVVANGRVYCTAYENSTNIGHLFVYGLNPTPPGAPAAASNASATAISASSITINWQDNSNDESGFNILRSTSATTGFALVGTSGANTTSYTDTGLAASTTYYYEVVAENTAGNANATNAGNATTFPVYAENGLIAYWNMDETSGSVAHDITGNGHNGSLTQEAYFDQSAYINGAIYFHGTGEAPSSVTVTNKADMQYPVSGSFTLAAWVNPSAFTSSSEETIIAKSRDQGNYYGIWINASHQWVGRGFNGTNAVDIVGPTVTSETWTHVALVQNGTAGTRQLYVNGALVASGSALAADGAGDLWMGEQNITDDVEAFPGSLDEVRLYNQALAASQITDLMGPPVLEGSSNQVHGSAGTFGVTIWPAPIKKIEPRKGSPVGSYSLALHFSAPVSGFTVSLQYPGIGTPVGTVGTWTTDSTGKVVTIPLTGVANTQGLNVHLSGIMPGNGTADIPFNVLWGDVNQDNIVDALDYAIVSNNATASVNAATAPFDINCDGAVNTTDNSLVQTAEGTNLGAELPTNRALYQAPTDSSQTGNVPAGAFDLNLGTRWESASSNPQWLMVNLGSATTIQQVALDWETAAGKTYTISVSNDGLNPQVQNGSNWTTLATETDNTIGNGAGVYPPVYVKYANPLSGTYQYVRMYGTTRTTNYGYSLWDFQVIGTASGTAQMLEPVVSSGAATGTTGSQFNYQIAATNTPTSYSSTVLPANLTLSQSNGMISGIPAQAGSTGVTISATNAGGTGNNSLTINVLTPFATWQNLYFTASDLMNPAISGPTATPAGDGITNLMKYALNLKPKVNGVAGLPTESMTASGGQKYLALTYTSVIADTDITYAVEVSSDLQTWNSGAGYTATVSTTTNSGNTTQTVVVRDLTAVSSTSPRFIRLKVIKP